MRFSTIIFATLCATATALDFTCDRDDVAVCCKGRDDEFEKCNTARQVTNRDDRHPEYHCRGEEYARCCEAHDITESPQTVTQTVPPVIQTETVYIVPQSQQQGVTVITVYQTYAYTIAKRFAAPEPTEAPSVPDIGGGEDDRRLLFVESSNILLLKIFHDTVAFYS
ncbi:hypothetical protein N431DRAFT_446692 [Stipitochalara longipes BDJ]|nr:hypothetical protein N431DRAFT_446692 [Stipitochalara longipes BDJ]